MAKQKHESGHVCKTDCCCDWSPHNQHVLWTVLMLLLIIFAGSVTAYLYQERNSFDNEIAGGMMNNEDKYVTMALKNAKDKSAVLAGKQAAGQMIPLTNAYLPYDISYPAGWHVEIEHKNDPKTLTTTRYGGFYSAPMVRVDGAITRGADIRLTDKPLAGKESVQTYLDSYKKGLSNVQEEKSIVKGPTGEQGTIYKVRGEVNARDLEGPGPYPTAYFYVIGYDDVGPEAFPLPHVLILESVTQEEPDGSRAVSESVKAAVDAMIKSFVPSGPL
ncbi:MAG: hypothetical protein HY461_01780 [Parcubacteria group bacterium]|nr:hypothetical protein [Parcubacteria group bacterium]